ncbi:hypothetical protein DFP72DRAFT_1061098 [Ephemerocybe angulata]|uniref:Uncharacterized protein n=1 Tax=Ephemerocybe angulata TaxID=980116 RepID=A0A8H6IEQ7_9AGAR|nr:hypothetical protein DFP72DRAFT_1061098 [Tulosesus angulatus]
MDADDDWNRLLKDHPIFSFKNKYLDLSNDSFKNELELSTNTLPKFLRADPKHDDPTPSGRRQTMILKDADLVVAVGKELRITALGDIKLGRSTRKSYKVLHTPNLDFEIHRIALNSNGKLLAVAGAFQVAVVIMPRAGYSRLVPDSIECKAVHIGQFYHGAEDAAPIAKVDWHPWGEAGSTLLVMTTDGKFREYDISVDTEEPQQVLSFVPPRKSGSFAAEDESEREVTSFTLGKGRADWGPLTVYALMKSGDIYALSPYLPQNASVPTSYVHSLECFISAKQDQLHNGTAPASNQLSTWYDYQSKYVNSLIKQLPPGTGFPANTRAVSLHPPKTIANPLFRQGPFLLQPVPRILDGSEGGDATDITYLSFTTDEDEADSEGDTDHLGVIVVAYQDGKVDVFLDVEKVEAKWETKYTRKSDLPMLAVYESIDLGLITTLTQSGSTARDTSSLALLQGNHPVFLPDPIHDDIVYVYHAFGVHALDVSPVLESLSRALRVDDADAEATLRSTLEQCAQTTVRPILTTFSVERKGSNPITGLAVPNDVYLTYSIFMLTSTLRITVFPLNLQVEPAKQEPKKIAGLQDSVLNASVAKDKSAWLEPAEGPAPYGLPPLAKLSLPSSASSKEFMLTPDTLRYIGKIVEQITGQIHELHVAQRAAEARVKLQQEELNRQVAKCREMEQTVGRLKATASSATGSRLQMVEETQKGLMKRLDKLLQSLMAKASPELSEQESKWFEELKRMKEEILGRGRYDEGALISRVKLLEREYARILPSLKSLVEREKAKNERNSETNRNLGFSQAFEYGKRSNEDAKRISKIENELVRLAAKLDLNLPRPPQSQ